MRPLKYQFHDSSSVSSIDELLCVAYIWGVTPNGLLCPNNPRDSHRFTVESWAEGPYTSEHIREIADCLSYISRITPIKSEGKQSSYGLKHEIERFFQAQRKGEPKGKSYVSNGAAIIALMLLRIPVWTRDGLNVVPGLSVKRHGLSVGSPEEKPRNFCRGRPVRRSRWA